MLPEILEDALKIGFTRDRALIERMLGLIRSRLVPVPYGQGVGSDPFLVWNSPEKARQGGIF